MLTKGGQTVAAGTYWNLMNGERVDLAEPGVLHGAGDTRYIKAPGAVMLLAGPLLGLLFAVFLPFIGIAMSIKVAASKVVDGIASAAAGSMTFGWRPVESYLSGRKGRRASRAAKGGGIKQ